MAFSSLPVYHLDPPNWNQPNHQPPSNDSNSTHCLISSHMISSSNQSPALNPAQPTTGNGGSGSKPVSMADRARLAKIPQPEQALKCPRCESTNTKFCYFNNYSLSQPRHLCKTCRRYWTRGGALRSVPVGGGCRRNKRSSSSSSKSSSINKSNSNNNNSSNTPSAISSSSSCSTAISGSAVFPSNFAPFLSSMHPFADHYGANNGLNFTAMQHQQQALDAGDYQLALSSGGGGPSTAGLEQWRIQQIQQFPFLGGLDGPVSGPMAGIYPNFFDTEMSKVGPSSTASGLITQLASVKMEDSRAQGLNLPRQYLGMPGNDQYLGGGWAGDLSRFNSS